MADKEKTELGKLNRLTKKQKKDLINEISEVIEKRLNSTISILLERARAEQKKEEKLIKKEEEDKRQESIDAQNASNDALKKLLKDKKESNKNMNTITFDLKRARKAIDKFKDASFKLSSNSINAQIFEEQLELKKNQFNQTVNIKGFIEQEKASRTEIIKRLNKNLRDEERTALNQKLKTVQDGIDGAQKELKRIDKISEVTQKIVKNKLERVQFKSDFKLFKEDLKSLRMGGEERSLVLQKINTNSVLTRMQLRDKVVEKIVDLGKDFDSLIGLPIFKVSKGLFDFFTEQDSKQKEREFIKLQHQQTITEIKENLDEVRQRVIDEAKRVSMGIKESTNETNQKINENMAQERRMKVESDEFDNKLLGKFSFLKGAIGKGGGDGFFSTLINLATLFKGASFKKILPLLAGFGGKMLKFVKFLPKLAKFGLIFAGLFKGITGLISGGFDKPFKEIFFNFIEDFFQGVFGLPALIGEGISFLLKKLGFEEEAKFITDLFKHLSNGLTIIFDWFRGMDFSLLKEVFTIYLGVVIDNIKTHISIIVGTVKFIFNRVKDLFTLIGKLWDGISFVAKFIFDLVKPVFVKIGEFIKEHMPTLFIAMEDFITRVKAKIAEIGNFIYNITAGFVGVSNPDAVVRGEQEIADRKQRRKKVETAKAFGFQDAKFNENNNLVTGDGKKIVFNSVNGEVVSARAKEFANGGIFMSPKEFIDQNGQRFKFGESGEEAIVPLAKQGEDFINKMVNRLELDSPEIKEIKEMMVDKDKKDKQNQSKMLEMLTVLMKQIKGLDNGSSGNELTPTLLNLQNIARGAY